MNPARYKHEVQTFVWDFLFRVVLCTMTMLIVFSAMSDQLLGLSRATKLNILVPELGLTAVIFILQVGIMTGIHAVANASNYHAKSRIVLGVACGQFLCAMLGLMLFTQVLSLDDNRQIMIFHWLLIGGLAAWDIVWFSKYLCDILFYDPLKYIGAE